MNNEAKLAITQVAQNGVDEILKQCRQSGSDPVEALKGAILMAEETLHWANEVLNQIEGKTE